MTSPGLNLPLQDLLCQRILDLLLDRALERPRPVNRIETGFGELVARLVRKTDAHITIGEPVVQVAQLYVDDLPNVLAAKWVEHDDVVNAIDELGTEVLPYDGHDRVFHCIVVFLTRQLLDQLRAQVRRHDDNRISQVDRSTLTIRQPTVVEHLQQYVEHVRMCFLSTSSSRMTEYGRRRTASVR